MANTKTTKAPAGSGSSKMKTMLFLEIALVGIILESIAGFVFHLFVDWSIILIAVLVVYVMVTNKKDVNPLDFYSKDNVYKYRYWIVFILSGAFNVIGAIIAYLILRDKDAIES